MKRLLQSALERPPGERDSFLQRECAGDNTLLTEVQALLTAHDQAGSFLDSRPSSDASEELEPGTILGSYEIISMIGAGGMGEVYRARDQRIGREVAIKRLPESLGADLDRLRRFEREARLAGSLNHPNLVTIHDVGSHAGKPFVVMELLRGETLRSELAHRLPVRKAIDYAIQIARGLAAAHEQGIVHRDLKPENIFVTDDGRLKILDFGLAKAVQREPDENQLTARRTSDGPTSHGVILGTAPYMSPEQVSGEPVDVRSDIFSFGVILYEILSGRHPFKHDSAIETMHAILTDETPDLPEVLPFLARIVMRCLEKKPAARFQSARDLGYALEDGSSISYASQSKRPRNLLVAISVAAIAIAIAALAWVFVSRRSKPVAYERLTFRRGVVTQARFAPDGRTVLFAAAWDAEPLRIFMKRPEADDVVPLDLPPADLLSVSRSGELAILVDARRAVPFGTTIGTLARISMIGGAPRRLVESVLSADWSPDGRSIAVVRDLGPEQRLEIRSSDGGEVLRQLFATSSGTMGHLRFSPSGDRIAFTVVSNRAGGRRADLQMINADGTGRRTLGVTVNFTDLVWSSDGREIWFAEGSLVQTTVRATSMSGRSRTIFQAPGNTSISDTAGHNVLMLQNDVVARVFCRARGATAEMEVPWQNWKLPLDITTDGRQVLIWGSDPAVPIVGLVPLDGSPLTELARGGSYGFSADQRSVLVQQKPRELAFVPIGAGERVVLSPTKLDAIAWAAVVPNGKSLMLAGVVNNTMRIYEKPIAGGELRPISNEPVYFPWITVSPDSASVAAIGPTRRLTVYSVGDGKAAIIPTSVPGDFPIRFADDGSLLYVRSERMPEVVYRFDFRTQRESVVREITPADPAGVLWASPTIGSMTGDAQCYCYQSAQVLSKLILARGFDAP
ncbi:MAG TPA: protein kinase [Thermoanaerobaculia bacterium]|nr:protein kinase [Thermoanaerobaculia bacterium]